MKDTRQEKVEFVILLQLQFSKMKPSTELQQYRVSAALLPIRSQTLAFLRKDNRPANWKRSFCSFEGGPVLAHLVLWDLSRAQFTESEGLSSAWAYHSKLGNRSWGIRNSQNPSLASLPSNPSYCCLQYRPSQRSLSVLCWGPVPGQWEPRDLELQSEWEQMVCLVSGLK